MEVGHDGLGLVSLQKVWITSQQKVSYKDCCFSDVVEMMCVLGQYITAFDFVHAFSRTTNNFIAEQYKIIN